MLDGQVSRKGADRVVGDLSTGCFFEDPFAPLYDVFRANFEAGLEIGAQCAVTIGGRQVVHLFGGAKDRPGGEPVGEDTVMRIFSSGKAVIALLMARAVDAGFIDYETPIARYWPEFGAQGKDQITVAEALSHQAGLCGFEEKIDPALWLDWDGLCAQLAKMRPLWHPGTAHGYHPQTVGYIAGEILRRATGYSIGQTLERDFHKGGAAPAALDVFSGIDARVFARAARMKKPSAPPALGEITRLKKIAFLTPWASGRGTSIAAMAAADIPASNMYATAASLARIMTPLAVTSRFAGRRSPENDAGISAETRAAMTQIRADGPDLCLGIDCRWGAGVMLNTDQRYGPERTAFGHSGFGGSCVFVDPSREMTFAYVMNRLSPHAVDDPRARALIDALYRCV